MCVGIGFEISSTLVTNNALFGMPKTEFITGQMRTAMKNNLIQKKLLPKRGLHEEPYSSKKSIE